MTTCPCCGQPYECDGLAVDLHTNTAIAPTGSVKLSGMEAEILHVVVEAAPKPVPTAEIERRVYGALGGTESNVVVQLAHRLRGKLAKLGYTLTSRQTSDSHLAAWDAPSFRQRGYKLERLA